jgi:hypothetical protein
MADNTVDLYDLQYRRLFPWLHLTRTFWIAIDVRKLILAVAALVLVSVGEVVIDQLPFGRSTDQAELRQRAVWPWQEPLGYDLPNGKDGLSELQGALRQPGTALWRVTSNWQIALLPFRKLIDPAFVVLRGDATIGQVADAVTRLLWNLFVWSIFGGAISRMCSVQFARDQQIGIRRALIFSASRFAGYVAAPLMPLVGIAILWMLCVLGGWIGRIPGGFGQGLLGVLWGLELLFGFFMAIVLIGVAIGWPLMFATISVEGTDGFDALSRAYNYVFERPLYLLWQAIVMMFYGSIVIYFVWLMAQLLTQLAVWGVSWGMGYDAAAGLIGGGTGLIAPGESVGESTAGWGAPLAGAWMRLLASIVVGFVYSFFWSSSTIIYFVLRHSVDANEFDEVFVEEAEERDELLPLVGTAAMEAEEKPPSAASPSATTPPPSPAPPPVDLAP